MTAASSTTPIGANGIFHQGGIDPGKCGVIARVRYDLGQRVGRLSLRAIPLEVHTQKGGERVSPTGVATMLRSLDLHALVLEQVFASKGEGAQRAKNFGEGRGVILGAAAALEIPFDEPHPSSWKKTMAVPSSKPLSVLRASQLMPACAGLWSKFKNQHDEAEAAMLALYGLFSRGLIPLKIVPEN